MKLHNTIYLVIAASFYLDKKRNIQREKRLWVPSQFPSFFLGTRILITYSKSAAAAAAETNSKQKNGWMDDDGDNNPQTTKLLFFFF